MRQPRRRAPAPGAAHPRQDARDGVREGVRGVRQGEDSGQAVFGRLGGMAAPPPAPPALLAGGSGSSRAPRTTPPPRRSALARGAARLSLVLDRRLRMG